MGAAGGSSERSWRDSSGSAVSSYVGAECVGATGAEATAVGAGGTSRPAKVRGAGSKGSRGSSDRSSNEESVNPGLVATRATKAAMALVLPVVDGAAEAAVEGRAPWAADAPAVGDTGGAEEVGAAEVANEDVAAEDVAPEDDAADPLEAPDVGDGAGADEVPGLAGRGGAFAAGGGEAAGAGRAGGTVGIAGLGVSLGDGAEPACVAEALGVAEVAGDAAGRLASAGVADAGRVASAARAVGMPAAPEPAGRAGAAPGDADPDAVVGAVVAPRVALDVDTVDAELNGAAPDVEPVAAAPGEELVGATPDAAPAGTALPLGADAVARGAVPDCAGCEDVDLVAAGLLEASAVGSVAGAVVDLRAVAAAADDADVGADADAVPEAVLPESAGVEAAEPVCAADTVADSEVGVAGAADRVGGIGASPDPRSAASNIGDAHVPE
jgi:hypothetical protein